MLRNWRHFIFVFVGSLGVTVSSAADPGYLPSVGPAYFRFSLPPAPVTNQFVLPLPPPVSETPAVTAKSEMFGPPAPPQVVITTAASTPTNYVPPVSVPDNSHPDEVVSPQMLLKFFNRSTNGASSTIIAPLEFTPPKSAEPPASKATYSTGP